MQYDRAGRSNGIANVIFTNKRDAMLSADRFHHVPLDGYPMQIEVVQSHLNRDSRNHPSSSRGNGRRQIPWDAGVSKERAPFRRQPTTMSTENLDNDLDAYMLAQ